MAGGEGEIANFKLQSSKFNPLLELACPAKSHRIKNGLASVSTRWPTKWLDVLEGPCEKIENYVALTCPTALLVARRALTRDVTAGSGPVMQPDPIP